MNLIAAGKTMKKIAARLEISIQTCSKHRTRVLEKMGAENDVELVRLLLTVDQNA
jgi:DNA-binding CsgD family transcriptional regulator